MLLNNKGWSLKEMLLLSCIILIAVFVAAVMVNNLYKGLDLTINNNSSSSNNQSSENKYKTIEKNLMNAAKNYARENELDEEDFIYSDTLIEEGYLTLSKMTNDDDICDGYVEKRKTTYKSYISCASYETDGY